MSLTNLQIRPYTGSDEPQWLRCRVLSFLDSAYFDDVARAKPCYQNPAIEWVAADVSGNIVGFIDVECEQTLNTVCSQRPGLGGMIWHLGVHPDYRRQGIAKTLLTQAIAISKRQGIQRLEAWTRDDPSVFAWYHAQGFWLVDHYLHVYLNSEESQNHLSAHKTGLRPIHTFAHCCNPAEFDSVRSQFTRVHDCHLFERLLDNISEDAKE
ncbi:MAG: N-acetyltransferase [Cyanobacteria bacterium P01_H01_bin.162]